MQAQAVCWRRRGPGNCCVKQISTLQDADRKPAKHYVLQLTGVNNGTCVRRPDLPGFLALNMPVNHALARQAQSTPTAAGGLPFLIRAHDIGSCVVSEPSDALHRESFRPGGLDFQVSVFAREYAQFKNLS